VIGMDRVARLELLRRKLRRRQHAAQAEIELAPQHGCHTFQLPGLESQPIAERLPCLRQQRLAALLDPKADGGPLDAVERSDGRAAQSLSEVEAQDVAIPCRQGSQELSQRLAELGAVVLHEVGELWIGAVGSETRPAFGEGAVDSSAGDEISGGSNRGDPQPRTQRSAARILPDLRWGIAGGNEELDAQQLLHLVGEFAGGIDPSDVLSDLAQKDLLELLERPRIAAGAGHRQVEIGGVNAVWARGKALAKPAGDLVWVDVQIGPRLATGCDALANAPVERQISLAIGLSCRQTELLRLSRRPPPSANILLHAPVGNLRGFRWAA
jgi:hypothetical protein